MEQRSHLDIAEHDLGEPVGVGFYVYWKRFVGGFEACQFLV
jgi:hypothetical protein